MAKQIAKKTAGAKTKTAKTGVAEVVKAKKVASGKKPEKMDTSGKGAVKKEQESTKMMKKSVSEKSAATVKKPAVAAKKATATGAKVPASKAPVKPAVPAKLPLVKKTPTVKEASAAKKPIKPVTTSKKADFDEPTIPESVDAETVDLDEELDPSLVGDLADMVADVDVEGVVPVVEDEGDGSPSDDKKDAPVLGRRVAAVKKPKIIVVTPTGPKKMLKLAPGLLLNTQKAPLATDTSACSDSDKKKEFRKLTKKEIAQIKEKLIIMREDILEKMRKELSDTRQRAGTAPADLVDQAADAYDDDVSFEIASANDEDLEQIEAALERLAEGTYGLCEICDVPISPARLNILPFATRCVACRCDYEKTRSRKDSGAWNFFGEGENGDSDEGHEDGEE